MRLDAVMLTAFGGGASSVEVAEGGVVESGVAAVVGEDFFESDFGFAVWVDGIFGVVFGDGDGVRFAVSSGGGREDEFFDAMAGHGVEKIDAAGDVGGIEGAGFADGFGDEGFGGEMHDGFEFVLREDFFDLCADAEISAAKRGPGRDGGGVAFLEIIESEDLMTAGKKNFGTDTANVTGGAGDEDIQ